VLSALGTRAGRRLHRVPRAELARAYLARLQPAPPAARQRR
jgi:hypothetical protein